MDIKFKPKTPSKLPDAMQILKQSQISISDVDAAIEDWDKTFPEYAGLLSALPIRESQTSNATNTTNTPDTGGD